MYVMLISNYISFYFFSNKNVSKNKFFVVVNSTVCTGVLRKNKKFLQKNSKLGRFRGENSIFFKVDFCYGLCWWIKPDKTGRF